MEIVNYSILLLVKSDKKGLIIRSDIASERDLEVYRYFTKRISNQIFSARKIAKELSDMGLDLWIEFISRNIKNVTTSMEMNNGKMPEDKIMEIANYAIFAIESSV